MKIRYAGPFKKKLKKIKDKGLRDRIIKATLALKEITTKGKPLKYGYKGNRSLRVKPFRIFYIVRGDIIEVTYFEHRNHAYKR